MKLEIDLKAKCCGHPMKRRDIVDIENKKRTTLLECTRCMKSIELEGVYFNPRN